MSNTTRSSQAGLFNPNHPFPVLALQLRGVMPALRPHVPPHRVPVILRVVSSIFGNMSNLWACYRLLRLPFAPGPGSEFVFPLSYSGHQGPASDADHDVVRLRNDEDDAVAYRTVSQWIDLGEQHGVQMITVHEDCKRLSKLGASNIEPAHASRLHNLQRRRLNSGWWTDPEDQDYAACTQEHWDGIFRAMLKELCHSPELDLYKEMAQKTFILEPAKPKEYDGPFYGDISDALADGWLLETEDGMTTWHHPQHWDRLDQRFRVDVVQRPLRLPYILAHGRYATDRWAAKNDWKPCQDRDGYYWTHDRLGDRQFDWRYRTDRPDVLPAALRSIPGCSPGDPMYGEERRLRDQPNTLD